MMTIQRMSPEIMSSSEQVSAMSGNILLMFHGVELSRELLHYALAQRDLAAASFYRNGLLLLSRQFQIEWSDSDGVAL